MRFEKRDTPNSLLRGMRVLIVEDEVLIALLLEDELSDAGAEVVGPVASVGEALALIETACGDGGLSAAVLDMNLQGETVLPVADRLAMLRIPFVFSTGYADGGQRGLHRAVPMLLKPFNGDVLPGVIRGLFVDA